ncbi:MAG: DUF4157 domain-containing protein [Alphaproteobacteria bacterium]
MRTATAARTAVRSAAAPKTAARSAAGAGRTTDRSRTGEGIGNQTALARLGGGQPLPSSLRAWFEPRLGTDLGGIRLHHGPAASAAAKSLGAQAFTVGSDVVFGSGRYRPETPKGRWLLAHELAHVGQARGTAAPAADAAVERDADRAASDMMRGRPARLSAGRDARRPHLFGEPQHVPETTYIAGQNPRNDGFLQDATAYHQAWGLRPRIVNSVEEIVDHLRGGRGKVGRIRIITHASTNNLYTALFRGGSPGILEPVLSGFAASDQAGLEALYGGGLLDAATYTGILNDLRTNNPAVLRPFGLDAANSTPSGAVRRLIERSADLLMHSAGRMDPAAPADEQATTTRQRGTIQATLRTILAGLRQAVQQPAPAGAGVTAQQAQDLQDAVTASTAFTFTLGVQPAAFAGALSIANTAIGRGFRAHLDGARARFDSSSWIDIRGCRVGGNLTYLQAVSNFFGAGADKPHVSAPDWWQSFPTVGYQTLLDADIATQAADSDVQTALDYWFGVTGVHSYMLGQIIYWMDLLIREQRERAPEGLRLSGPQPGGALLGGLVPPEGLGLTPPLLPRLGGMQLQPPGLLGPGPASPGAGLGLPQMRNPIYSLAEGEVTRLRAELARIDAFTTEEKLRYYLDMALVLPVQAAADPENIRLFMKHSLRGRAMNNWLGSIWSTRAPGLAALQRRGVASGDARRVEAVVDQDPQRAVTEMYISPDPRYAEHIKSI